jgi:hypothetical protein
MSATASTHLPSVDEWMTMRAKLVAVIGDTPATTLLSVLPQPVDGGFASNGRLEQMEARLRGEITELRAETHTEFAHVRSEIAVLRTDMRTEFTDVRSEMRIGFAEIRTEIAKSAADTLKSMRGMFFQLVGVMCTLGGLAIAAAKFL